LKIEKWLLVIETHFVPLYVLTKPLYFLFYFWNGSASTWSGPGCGRLDNTFDLLRHSVEIGLLALAMTPLS
jgi:hypothetical protein